MRFVDEGSVTATPAASDKFSGAVWRSEILPTRRDNGLRAHRFAYAPGARSAWHIHDGEQALYVVAGRGLVTRWGEEHGTPVGPGDWVHVEPGEKHWHGAVPDDIFVHVAVTATGGTSWEGHVE
jgi:quercetin dioxygenase-like cupin family protein